MELRSDQCVASNYSMICMTDLGSWISMRYNKCQWLVRVSARFCLSFISLSYLGHTLCLSVFSFFVFSASCFSLSSLHLCFYYSVRCCHLFIDCLRVFLHPYFHLFVSFLCLQPTPPASPHQDFCHACWHCTNWGIGTFILSPFSGTEQCACFKVSPNNNENNNTDLSYSQQTLQHTTHTFPARPEPSPLTVERSHNITIRHWT